jgi:hypothetical protein
MHKFLDWCNSIAVVVFWFGTEHPVFFLLHPAQSRKKKGGSSLKNLNVKEIRQKDMEGSRKDAD